MKSPSRATAWSAGLESGLFLSLIVASGPIDRYACVAPSIGPFYWPPPATCDLAAQVWNDRWRCCFGDLRLPLQKFPTESWKLLTYPQSPPPDTGFSFRAPKALKLSSGFDALFNQWRV